MKVTLFGIVAFASSLISGIQAYGQSEPSGYRDFPLIITLQFHCLSTPFRDIGTNFRNVGIGIGSELSYTGSPHGVQQLSILWYRNRNIGNGIMIYTQAVWRPTLGDNAFAELKTGIGYLYAFRPVDSFASKNGQWVSVGKKGKGMLAVPTGISLGAWGQQATGTTVSPFVSYQFLLISGYNDSVPIIPETIVQAGVRVK